MAGIRSDVRGCDADGVRVLGDDRRGDRRGVVDIDDRAGKIAINAIL